MIKTAEKAKPVTPVAVRFNSLHDYVTFALLMSLIVGAMVALYLYDRQTQMFSVWAKEFYGFLLN